MKKHDEITVTIKGPEQCLDSIQIWIEKELSDRTPGVPDCVVEFWRLVRNAIIRS